MLILLISSTTHWTEDHTVTHFPKFIYNSRMFWIKTHPKQNNKTCRDDCTCKFKTKITPLLIHQHHDSMYICWEDCYSQDNTSRFLASSWQLSRGHKVNCYVSYENVNLFFSLFFLVYENLHCISRLKSWKQGQHISICK